MSNIIFLSISFIIYMVVLLYFIKKADDIFHNPEKYTEIPGWKRYCSSFWYETEDEKFFISKHHIACGIVTLPMWLILVAGYYFFVRLIQKQFFIPDDATQLFTQNIFLGVMACIFFAIGISFWVPFRLKAPIFIACTLYAYHTETKRSKAWKKTSIMMIAFSALCLPLMTLAVNTYAYADENKIAENKIFQFIESEIYYDEIANVETSFESNPDETKYFFSYLATTKDGKQINLFDYKMDDVLYVHNQLLKRQIPMKFAAIDALTYENMKVRCGADKLKAVEKCFIIEE